MQAHDVGRDRRHRGMIEDEDAAIGKLVPSSRTPDVCSSPKLSWSFHNRMRSGRRQPRREPEGAMRLLLRKCRPPRNIVDY